jgi:HEPN domain
MGVESKKANKPIAKLLHAAGLDLDAATRLLAEPPNDLAANHLQQAAEKILAAVRLHRGLLNTRDHDLVLLIDGRPAASRAHSLMGTHGVSGSGRSSRSPRTRRRFAIA